MSTENNTENPLEGDNTAGMDKSPDEGYNRPTEPSEGHTEDYTHVPPKPDYNPDFTMEEDGDKITVIPPKPDYAPGVGESDTSDEHKNEPIIPPKPDYAPTVHNETPAWETDSLAQEHPKETSSVDDSSEYPSNLIDPPTEPNRVQPEPYVLDNSQAQYDPYSGYTNEEASRFSPQYGETGTQQYGNAHTQQYGEGAYGTSPASHYGDASYGTNSVSQYGTNSASQYGTDPYSSGQSMAQYQATGSQATQYPQTYGYGYSQAKSTNTLALLSMIVSLVSIVFAGFFSLVGVIMGHIALKQIKQTGEEGRGLALIGLIVGYVQLGLIVLGVIGFTALTLIAMASS